MQVPVYNLSGEVVKNIELSDRVFAVPFNEALVHQAMLAQRANARQGTAATKTRGEVAGSGRKLYQQKHTGQARVGGRRSPSRRGGGVAFGPHPRSYRQATPKKMRQQALRCVLSAKAGDGALKVLEKMSLDEPKTKKMVQILAALGVAPSVLIVTGEPEGNTIKSARNLPGTKTMTANLLNVLDILSYKVLLMTEEAVHKAERLWGQEPGQEESHESL